MPPKKGAAAKKKAVVVEPPVQPECAVDMDVDQKGDCGDCGDCRDYATTSTVSNKKQKHTHHNDVNEEKDVYEEKKEKKSFFDGIHEDDVQQQQRQNSQTVVSGSSQLIKDHPGPPLTKEQQNVLDIIKKGQSVFITGPSGCGKTYLIPHIVKHLEDTNGDKVAITSVNPAGAVALSGRTIHAFSGLGLCDDSIDVIRTKAKTQYMRKIYDSVDAIVIDDIQRIEPRQFIKILVCAQEARSRKKDDIQWILLGDFFNRPSMSTKRFDQESKSDKQQQQDEPEFLFELPEWSKIIHHTIILRDDLMHKDDPVYAEVLNKLRWGVQEIHEQGLLNKRIDAAHKKQGSSSVAGIGSPLNNQFEIVPTELTLFDTEADIRNRTIYTQSGKLASLSDLPSEAKDEWTFYAFKGYRIGNTMYPYNMPLEYWRREAKAEHELNDNTYIEKKKQAMLQFLEKYAPVDSTLNLRIGTQVMLTADLDVTRQLVVGSRGVVVGIGQNSPYYPIVKFRDHMVVIRAHRFEAPVDGDIFAWYAQIPLKHAWAISVRSLTTHSIDGALIKLKDIKDYGMAYSILAKVRSLNDLYLSEIDWGCIRAHEKVQKYYTALRTMAVGKK